MLKNFLVIIFLLFSITYSYGKDVEITADELLIDKEQDLFIAKGNVITNFEGYTVYSDNIFYDKKYEIIYIEGKLKFINDFLGIGESLKYDLKNKEGYLSRVDLFYFSPDKKRQKFISGEDIIIYDKDNYNIKRGNFSSCEGEKKAWYIKGSDINITLGEYLTAKNVTLYGGSVPVVFVPYFLAPIKKEKETGFLYPYFGLSGKNGFIMNLPYYFFLDESYDDTLTLKMRTKNTIGLDNEFRYKLSKNEEGVLNLSLYDNYEKKRDYGLLNFRHAKDTFLKADLYLINRRDFFYEYNNDINLRSLPFLRSSAFYEIKSNRALYSLNLFNGYNLNLNEKDFLSLSINRNSFPLGLTRNLFYNIDGSLSYFNKGNKDFERIYLSPYGLYRYSKNNYDLSLKIFADMNYYSEELKGEQKRTYLILNPSGETYKSLLIDDKYLARNSLKLTSFLPFRVVDDLTLNNDLTDFFNKSKRIELALQQETISVESGQLLYNLKISQSYFLDDLYQKEKFSDTSLLFRTIATDITFGLLGEYNHKRSSFSKFLAYGDYKSDFFSFNLNYNKNIGPSEFITISLTKKLNDNINTGLSGRYDLSDKILKETGLIFDYLKNCYSIKLDLRNRKEPSEFIFLVYINLYGLGEIKFE
ncbi:MAG: hypothetical protein N2999_06185 [Proteobacteria bacterium]|nr:hypothetical protein [Pseudomonadota bacterium]